MSLSLSCFCLSCRVVVRNTLIPCVSLVPFRGKKKVAKKKMKTKKELQREAMKDYIKGLELEKQAEEAVMKVAKQGEPLDPEMLNPARKRQRLEISEEQKERNFLMVKEWTRYKMEEHKLVLQQLQRMMFARDHALRELRKVSLQLYIKSIETRKDLFPFERVGPTFTPRLEEYVPPELEDS